MMTQHTERCKNCSQHLLLQQKFCHLCGQKTDVHRIDLHYFLHELPHSIFHVDGGILFTLRELFTRPGSTIREYLDGRRKPHFKPLMLVLVMGSFCALLQLLVKKHKDVEKSDQLIQSNLSKSEIAKYIDFKGLVAYFTEVFHWLSSHFAFTVLLMLPVTALAFFLGFRKYKLNYPEWVVIFLFLGGQSLAIYVFFIFLNFFVGDYTWLYFFLSWVIITLSLIQFFQKRGRKYIILRVIWSIFLSYLFTFFYVIFAIIAVSLIGILLYGYDNIVPVILQKL